MTHTTKISLRERIGMWLSHRAPWEDCLSLMTCGKPNHIWRSMNGYRPEDCPMCALEDDVKRLHNDKMRLLEKSEFGRIPSDY